MLEQLTQLVFNPLVGFFSSMRLINVLEILVLSVFVFKIYGYIAGTQVEQLLKGILMLVLALVISKIFNLQIIGRVLETVVNIVLFSLVVIFQPELRRLLGYIGQKGFLSKNVFNQESESGVKDIVENLASAVKHLSKSHTGALIVFQNSTGMEHTMEVGTKLNASISTELILTIFHPNTPLHDGAVVIKGNKIIGAGVLLPLTEDPKLSWQYGTRHRAAIGMSEVSDATCLVVSEETGNISVAQGGKLINVADITELKSELEFLYGISESVCKRSEDEVREKIKFRFQDFLPSNNLLFKKSVEK